ncbi:MAG: hypothetical protein KGL16_00485 [Acidobacteriota bacterium]|nr:hypothetical protein [Acidobacteriota bacterium]
MLLSAGAAERPTASAGRSALTPAGDAAVSPKAPAALAVSASGTLYIVDPERDQILRLLPSGRFAVFAGRGRHGFSGDGGPAARARLGLNSNSTIAVAPGGTVYIADTGNNRVRAVAPGGPIRTLVRVNGPAGLALAPHGQLYISGQGLSRLSLRNGRLRWLVRWAQPPSGHNRVEYYLASGTLNDVAVDRAGDLYVAGFSGIFERTASGAVRCLGSFRAGGAPAQLTEGPGGALYGATFTVFRLGASALDARGSCDGGAPLVAERSTEIVAGSTIRRVDRALGWRDLARAHLPLLSPSSGLAVGDDGAIYYDAASGNGWATGALVEIEASGRVRMLWRAPR